MDIQAIESYSLSQASGLTGANVAITGDTLQSFMDKLGDVLKILDDGNVTAAEQSAYLTGQDMDAFYLTEDNSDVLYTGSAGILWGTNSQTEISQMINLCTNIMSETNNLYDKCNSLMTS